MHLAKSFPHVALVNHGTLFLSILTILIIKTDECLELNDNTMHLFNSQNTGHLDL